MARPSDDIERAHLRDPTDETFHIHRYAPEEEVAGLLRRFWIPVWSVPPGEQAVQKVLQYPICLAVTTPAYARFAGPYRGLSTTVLAGRAWAFGAMFQPAAGWLLLGRPVSTLTDSFVDLEDVPRLRGLTEAWRRIMDADPDDPEAHRRGRLLLTERLVGLELDEESLLVNALVERVESDTSLTSVGQLCEAFGLNERGLQRLTGRRLGLTPLWLIRRRRLHEAAERLRDGTTTLATIAAELGFADQAHFSRDFKASTGMTPGEFERTQRR